MKKYSTLLLLIISIGVCKGQQIKNPYPQIIYSLEDTIYISGKEQRAIIKDSVFGIEEYLKIITKDKTLVYEIFRKEYDDKTGERDWYFLNEENFVMKMAIKHISINKDKAELMLYVR